MTLLATSRVPGLWEAIHHLCGIWMSESARTNNHIEGGHSKLKKAVGKVHPNFYEIVEIFKREQGVPEITISQLASEAIPSTRGKKSTDKDKKIQELKKWFSENTITLEEYVQGMSGHTNIYSKTK